MNNFETFVMRLDAYLRSLKADVSVRYECDEEKGLYIAHLSDGMKILGNSISKKLTIRYGADHQMQFAIPEVA